MRYIPFLIIFALSFIFLANYVNSATYFETKWLIIFPSFISTDIPPVLYPHPLPDFFSFDNRNNLTINSAYLVINYSTSASDRYQFYLNGKNVFTSTNGSGKVQINLNANNFQQVPVQNFFIYPTTFNGQQFFYNISLFVNYTGSMGLCPTINMTNTTLNITNTTLNITNQTVNVSNYTNAITNYTINVTNYTNAITNYTLNLSNYTLNLSNYSINAINQTLNLTVQNQTVNVNNYTLNLSNYTVEPIYQTVNVTNVTNIINVTNQTINITNATTGNVTVTAIADNVLDDLVMRIIRMLYALKDELFNLYLLKW